MADKYQVWNADEAVLRFYELMYLSYPPTDVLPCLYGPSAWATVSDSREVAAEYERFRWAVLEWCLRNWPRLIADSARAAFLDAIKAELRAETTLVAPLFEGLASRRNDDFVKDFILSTVNTLFNLELGGDKTTSLEQRIRTKLILENALTLFLLSMPWDELKEFTVNVEGHETPLLDHLANLANALTAHDLTFIGQMHLCFTRPRRPDPAWTLQAVSENLFRSRDPDDPIGGSHRLLPRLLAEVDLGTATSADFRLLQSGLSLFLAALDDLALFAADHAIPFREIAVLGNSILDWMKLHPGGASPAAVTQLRDALSLESLFCKSFGAIFHESVEGLRPLLMARVHEIQATGGKLQFDYLPNIEVQRYRVMTPVHRLISFLTNWSVDQAKQDKSRTHKSRITVNRRPMPIGTDHVCFRILTNFSTLEATQERTTHGRNYDVEFRMLTTFGGKLPDHWNHPSEAETEEGFTAAYEFLLPIGFTPRSLL